MMTALLFITSLFSIIGVSVLAYGYRASLFSDDPATRWFARSMALLAVAVFVRRMAWDIIHPIVNSSVDQRPINIMVNIVTIFAVYAGLKARLALIPDDERGDWHWWSAWQHPSIWAMRVDRPIASHEKR